MPNELRIAIVAHRFDCLGGIQTLFLELIGALNEAGTVPTLVWDEPQDWDVLGRPEVRTTFGGGRLPVSSARLRRLPVPLARILKPWSVRHADLGLGAYDFVYCFEGGVRMPKDVPNLCWLAGPGYLRLPGDRVNWRRFWAPSELKLILSHALHPLTRKDRHSSYVTHSEYIAGLIEERWGVRLPVIWPPARSRRLPAPPEKRGGFLYLSRLEELKRADTVLNLAKALPDQRFTLAGAVTRLDGAFLAHLRDRLAAEGIGNVAIVENPSEAEVARLLVSHEFFVFPAHWEHFGIVTVEAILAGLLPLVHDTGGQREIVPDESLRFLSDADLLDRARRVLGMTPSERAAVVRGLQRHAQRGTPEQYREIMLQKVRDVPHLKDRLGRRSGGDALAAVMPVPPGA
jgi:glycosyltransferase involved in cell wall biosynthesis